MIDVSGPFYHSDEGNNGANVKNFKSNYYSCHWQGVFHANMQEIIPGVYLGPYAAAQSHCLAALLEKGIRYIICVRQEVEAHFISPQTTDPAFTYLTLDIADNDTENIIRFFPRVRQFIEEAHSKNCKVLVHGNTGNSRSATLVLAYIMEKFGLTSDEALLFVKEKRATVNPNEGFKAQLTEYEPIYKARQTLDNGEPSLSNSRQKRKSEQLSDCDSLDYDLIQPPPSPITENNNEVYECPDFSNHLYRLWLTKKS